MRSLTVLALLLSSSLVWGADARLEPVGGAEFNRSERYLVSSDAVGDQFRIDVLLPPGYEQSKQTYPVVYVTDSNFLLSSAAASGLAQATGEFSQMIIVGVGWDLPSIARIRARDLSPTCDAEYQKSESLADDECGGADAFVAFLKHELQPAIDRKYRTADDNTLVGYSFGGLFALHVLFNHTDTFDRYLIGSASMNWDEQLVFKQEQKYAATHKDMAARVYLSAGSLEGNRTIPNLYLMYERLIARNYPSLAVELEVLKDETHMTSIAPFVLRGMRSVGFAR